MVGQNVNPLIERQTAGLLITNPRLIDEDADMPLWFEDPVAKSAVNAVVAAAKGRQPITIEVVAHLMGRNGAPGTTPETLHESVMKLVTPEWGTPEPASNMAVLRDLWIRRKAASLIADASKRMNLGEDPAAVLGEAYAKAEELSRRDARILTTDSWALEAKRINEQQRTLSRSGTLAMMPGSFDRLHRMLGRLPEGIIISHLAWTGGGKTMLAQQTAHWWARVHGRTVLYLPTELSVEAMMWRWICGEVTGVTFQMLQDGVVDMDTPAIAEALKPYPSGGRVIYMEAGGMTPAEAVANSRKYRWKDKSGREVAADLVCDYPDGMRMADAKGREENYTLAVRQMLDLFKSHGQRWHNYIWCTWQVNKEVAGTNERKEFKDQNETSWQRTQKLRPKDAMGSVYPSVKSNLFLISDGYAPMKEPENYFRDPFTEEDVRLPGGSDCYSPIGVIRVAKNTFGPNGVLDVVWRDGPRFRMAAVPDVLRDEYRKKI